MNVWYARPYRLQFCVHAVSSEIYPKPSDVQHPVMQVGDEQSGDTLKPGPMQSSHQDFGVVVQCRGIWMCSGLSELVQLPYQNNDVGGNECASSAAKAVPSVSTLQMKTSG